MAALPDITLVATCARDTPAGLSVMLPFDVRCRSRFRATVPSGRVVVANLPRGTTLRGGDKVRDAAGEVVEILAADEALLEARGDAHALVRAAYHLGNRHVPVEIGVEWLRLRDDHVLHAMLQGLGIAVTAVHAPFEPEPGAYAGGHTHALPARARIHVFGDA